MKNCLTFHDITKQNICMLAQREIFAKFAIKSTIFELQQSYLHIFGVAQNFQFNGGAQKRGGAVAPPRSPLYTPFIKTYVIPFAV